MELDAVKKMIEQGFSTAEVEVTGDGCSLEAVVVSPDFSGKSRIQQHRMVMDTVKELLAGGELHALSINTYTPEAWAKQNS